MRIQDKYREIKNVVGKSSGTDRDLLEYFFLRPISAFLLLFCGKLNCSPNIFTTLSIIFSFIAGLCLLNAHVYTSILWAVLFLNISLFLDSFDGAYARYKKMNSEYGAWYDQIADTLKYAIFFLFATIGGYYNLEFPDIFFIAGRELYLFSGLWIISNLFMIYVIHISRYHLSFNPGSMVTVDSGRFYVGIESLLYTIFTVFLLLNQIYGLFLFLNFFLPVLWIVPFYKTYKAAKK